MSVNLPNKAASDSALVQSTNRCSNFHKGEAGTTRSATGNGPGTGTGTGRPLPRRAVRDMMPAE